MHFVPFAARHRFSLGALLLATLLGRPELYAQSAGGNSPGNSANNNSNNGAANGVGNGNGNGNNSGNAGGNSNKAAGDAAWTVLQTSLAQVPTGNSNASAAWAALAAAAQKFQHDFPQSTQVQSAGKLAATALIFADNNLPNLSAKAVSTASSFVDDYNNATADRVSVMIALDQANLRRISFTSQADWMAAHAAHARELIRRFPDQPEGYGYLTSLAAHESTSNTHHLADEIVANPAAPPAFRDSAQRVIDRLALVGRPLVLPAAQADINAARHNAVVVYTWEASDLGFLHVIQQLAPMPHTQFIGINLDTDQAKAQAAVVQLHLPGHQYYDGNGKDGPMARQLHLISYEGLYFVDPQGVVRDVNGQSDPLRTLSRLIGGKE